MLAKGGVIGKIVLVRVQGAAPEDLGGLTEDLLPALDATLDFVGLADGDTTRARQIAIQHADEAHVASIVRTAEELNAEDRAVPGSMIH
mgnify:CR=1 FL=1